MTKTQDMCEWLQKQELFLKHFGPDEKILVGNLPEIAERYAQIRRMLLVAVDEPITATSATGVMHAITREIAEGNVTLAEIGRRCGMDEKTIRKWLNGSYYPNADTLFRALAAAGLAVEVHRV